MILKKPYAFLIKHFRLIHLFILFTNIFFIWNINQIHLLFSRLHVSGTFMFSGANNYVSSLMYINILLMGTLSIFMYILLNKKKKPSNIYLLMIVFSLVDFLSILYTFSNLSVMETKTISLDTIIFLNDITFVLQIPSYFFSVICLIRGIGFNIKQFNFSKDIEALDIADKDSEEFEFMLGQNNYKYFRKLRRLKRELMYYIIENKFSVVAISLTVFVIFSGIGFYNYTTKSKTLKSSETASINGLVYSVNYSYLTSYDFSGNIVNKSHRFVVINMTFFNNSIEAKSLDLTKIFLYDGKKLISPSLSYNSKFYDFGVPYIKDRKINVQNSYTATLCFEVPSNTRKTNYELRVQYGTDDSSINNYTVLYKKFKINAKDIDKKDNTILIKMNELVSVDLLGYNKFNIKINSYKLDDIFESKYVICREIADCNVKSTLISSRKYTNMTLLQIDYDGLIYESANFSKSLNTFNKIFGEYTDVEYVVNGKKYIEKGKVIDDGEVDNKVFLVVPRKINNALSISLIFNFRNDKYKVVLS